MNYIKKIREKLNRNTQTVGNSLYNGLGDLLTTKADKTLLGTAVLGTALATPISGYTQELKIEEIVKGKIKIRDASTTIELYDFDENKELDAIKVKLGDGTTTYLHKGLKKNPETVFIRSNNGFTITKNELKRLLENEEAKRLYDKLSDIESKIGKRWSSLEDLFNKHYKIDESKEIKEGPWEKLRDTVNE